MYRYIKGNSFAFNGKMYKPGDILDFDVIGAGLPANWFEEVKEEIKPYRSDLELNPFEEPEPIKETKKPKRRNK